MTLNNKDDDSLEEGEIRENPSEADKELTLKLIVSNNLMILSRVESLFYANVYLISLLIHSLAKFNRMNISSGCCMKLIKRTTLLQSLSRMFFLLRLFLIMRLYFSHMGINYSL